MWISIGKWLHFFFIKGSNTPDKDGFLDDFFTVSSKYIPGPGCSKLTTLLTFL